MELKSKNRTQQLQQILPELKNELSRILDFWSTKAVDLEFGGFVGQVDSVGEIIPMATKGVVLNTRILGLFRLLSAKPDKRLTLKWQIVHTTIYWLTFGTKETVACSGDVIIWGIH